MQPAQGGCAACCGERQISQPAVKFCYTVGCLITYGTPQTYTNHFAAIHPKREKELGSLKKGGGEDLALHCFHPLIVL